MANLRQDRVPDPTLSRSSAPSSESPAANGRPANPRGIVLSLRLRTQDSSGTAAAVSWAGSSPAAAVVLDVTRASGGAPDPPQGAVLPARFFNLQSALLAARRIGWALEGVAESGGSATVADLAIHIPGDPLDVALAASPSLAPETGAGRVLLSVGLAEAVQQLPGLTVRPAAGAGPAAGSDWRVLEWRSEAGPASFAADEQSVLGLIRALSRQDPLAAPPPPPPTATLAPLTPTRGFATPTGLGRAYEERETASPFWKKPWVVVSAAAAVVILAALLIIPAVVSHPKSATADGVAKPTSPATSSSAPSNDTGSAAGSASPQSPAQPKPTAKGGKPPHNTPKGEPMTESKTETPPPIKQTAGSCDLTEGEIPNSLNRAERLMYQGKLADAQSAYQRLVGCPSAREKALEGLQRVKQRIAAQSSQ